MPASLDLASAYAVSGVALVCWCWTLLLSELQTNLSKAASTGLSLIPGDSHDSDIADGLVTAGRQPCLCRGLVWVLDGLPKGCFVARLIDNIQQSGYKGYGGFLSSNAFRSTLVQIIFSSIFFTSFSGIFDHNLCNRLQN